MLAALSTWFAAAWLQSLVLGALALVVARRLGDPSARTWVLRLGLFGGLAAASLQVGLGVGWEPALGLLESSPAVSAALPSGPGPAWQPSRDASGALALPPSILHAPRVPAQASADGAPGVELLSAVGVALLVWLGVVSVALLRERARFVARLERAPLEDPDGRALLRELVGRRGAARIALSASSRCSSPLALSAREICVPRAGWAELPLAQRRALLAHEVAHLLRRDPLWRLAAHGVERALLLAPLQRRLRTRLEADAERLADAWAARRTGAPLALAECLASVAGWSRRPTARPLLVPGMVVHEDESSALVARVEALVGEGLPAPVSARRAACAAGAAGLALLAFACAAPRVDGGGSTVSGDTLAEGPAEGLAEDEPVQLAAPNVEATLQAPAAWSRFAVERPLPDEALLARIAADGAVRLQGGADQRDYGTFDLESEAGVTQLRAALAEAAAGFPRGGPPTLDADDPLAAQLSSGRLRMRVEPQAPYKYVQRVMTQCGTFDVLLWDLELESSAAPGRVVPVPLPTEVGVAVELLEEGEEPPAFDRPVLELRLDSPAAGPVLTLQPQSPNPRALPLGDGSAVNAAVGEWYEILGDVPVRLDARPGATFQEANAILDAVLRAGFTNITFVGEYDAAFTRDEPRVFQGGEQR